MEMTRNQLIRLRTAVSRGIKLGRGWRELEEPMRPFWSEGIYYDPESEVNREVDAVMDEIARLDMKVVKDSKP